jgi:hypothetical protein
VQVHPEELFVDWLKLACHLATHTSPTRRPVVWPVYDHDNLNESIRPLMEELRRSLSAVLEQSAIAIELEERSHGVRVGRMPDPVLVRNAGFVLAVHADLPAEAVQQRFPTQVKIGSVERIRDLVQLQLPGVVVRPLPVAPRQIPYNAGYHYFELDKSGDMWRQLEKSGGVAMHLAGDFPGSGHGVLGDPSVRDPMNGVNDMAVGPGGFVPPNPGGGATATMAPSASSAAARPRRSSPIRSPPGTTHAPPARRRHGASPATTRWWPRPTRCST